MIPERIFIDGVTFESTILGAIIDNIKLHIGEIFCQDHEDVAQTIVNSYNNKVRTPNLDNPYDTTDAFHWCALAAGCIARMQGNFEESEHVRSLAYAMYEAQKKVSRP